MTACDITDSLFAILSFILSVNTLTRLYKLYTTLATMLITKDKNEPTESVLKKAKINTITEIMKKTKGYFYCSIIARAFLNYNK